MSATAKRVAQAMREEGIDQPELAMRLGVSQGTISKIVLGKTANSRLLPRIAEELGRPIGWLLGKSDDVSHGERLLSADQREWLNYFDMLTPADRAALLHVARSMNGIAAPSKQVLHSPKPAYRGEKVAS